MTNCEVMCSQRLRLMAQTRWETAHLYTTIAQTEVNPSGMRPEMSATSFRCEKSVPLARACILASDARARLRGWVDPIDERIAVRAATAKAKVASAERTVKVAAQALIES
jgi:hypothetical protein